MPRIWTTSLLLLLLLGTIGCDQATKRWASTTLERTGVQTYVDSVITLEYAENTGAFLSLGADWSPRARFVLFTASTGVLLMLAGVVLLREAASSGTVVGLFLFLGGGASNLLDRVTRGAVIDFMNVGVGPVRTGIFNVADVAIMLGAGVAVLCWARQSVGHGSICPPQNP